MTINQYNSGHFIPTVNIITKVGEPTRFPHQVFLSNQQNQHKGKIGVKWEDDDLSFEQLGKQTVSGETADGTKVKGILHVFAQEHEVTIATIGDSITEGWGLAGFGQHEPETCYPQQLQSRLGTGYRVGNFGDSGATLVNRSQKAYRRKEHGYKTPYQRSLEFSPDVVVIQLGTNDSWWDNAGQWHSFVQEYVDFIKEYRSLSTQPVVYICLPPAHFVPSGNRLVELIPYIIDVAKQAECEISIIDNYSPIVGKRELFPANDTLHPNDKGAGVLANNVFETIMGERVFTPQGIVSSQQFSHAKYPVNRFSTQDNGFYLSEITNNDWVLFKQVSFTNNCGYIGLETKSTHRDSVVEVRLDKQDGPIIGSGLVKQSNNWAKTGLFIEPVTGQHDIYLVFRTKHFSQSLQLKSIDFTDGKGEIVGLKNGDFEDGINYWRGEGNADYGVDNSDAYSGAKLWIYHGNPYQHKLYQTIRGLENGIYTFSARVKQNFGYPNKSFLLLQSTSDEMTKVALHHSDHYQQIETVIEVTDNILTISFNQESSRAANLQIDDVTLVKGAKNYVENGDFSAGMQYWQVTKDYIYRVKQNVLVSNGNYIISAKVKQDPNDKPGVSEMRVLTASGQIVIPISSVQDEEITLSQTVNITDGQCMIEFYQQHSGHFSHLDITSVTMHKM